MKIIMLLLLSVLGCVPSTFVVDHYAVISDAHGFHGSAVAIGGGRYLTATHVLNEADSSSWLLLGTDTTHSFRVIRSGDDISVIFTNESLDSVRFSLPYLGEEVYWVQPIAQKNQVFRILARGIVGNIYEHGFAVDRPFYPGASGSGIWNKAGELVGIVDAVIDMNNSPMIGLALTVDSIPR